MRAIPPNNREFLAIGREILLPLEMLNQPPFVALRIPKQKEVRNLVPNGFRRTDSKGLHRRGIPFRDKSAVCGFHNRSF